MAWQFSINCFPKLRDEFSLTRLPPLIVNLHANETECSCANSGSKHQGRLRQWTPHGRQWTPHGRQWIPHGRQWTLHGRQWTPHGRQWTPHGRQWTPQERQGTPHGRQWTPHGKLEGVNHKTKVRVLDRFECHTEAVMVLGKVKFHCNIVAS